MDKKIVKKILPKSMITLLKRGRLKLYKMRNGLKLINTPYHVLEIGDSGTDTFFGYYDISPFNDKNELLYLEVPKAELCAKIILNDISGSNKKVIATTNAFNTQQGSRLRWYPGTNDEVVFNDYIDGKYVSRKVNINTQEEVLIPYPLYDISPNGKYAVTLNFERLGVLRPGYGYTNKPYVPDYNLGNEGIYLVDMSTYKYSLIITYKEIAKVMGEYDGNYDLNYINHLSFSPNGDKFLFFWLKNERNWTKAYMLQYNLKSKEIIVLENELRVSHYTWINNDVIMCTAISGSSINNMECRYYVYEAGKKRKVVGQNDLLRDGHPTLFKDTIILTDTYPDVYSYQLLFMYDKDKAVKYKLVYSYSVPVKNEVFRTDMHPRFNIDKSIICYDANVKGERRLYLLKDWNHAIN